MFNASSNGQRLYESKFKQQEKEALPIDVSSMVSFMVISNAALKIFNTVAKGPVHRGSSPTTPTQWIELEILQKNHTRTGGVSKAFDGVWARARIHADSDSVRHHVAYFSHVNFMWQTTHFFLLFIDFCLLRTPLPHVCYFRNIRVKKVVIFFSFFFALT